MTLTVEGVPLIGYLLASVRIVAWLAIVPPFSTRAVPAMAKVVLALGLAFTATPTLQSFPTGTPELLVLALTQVAIGASMGFVTMLLFSVVAAAGSIVDVFGGFSMAQGFDPLGMNQSTVFGRSHQMLATTLLLVSGGHLIVIGGLLRSFEVVPLGETPALEHHSSVLTTAFTMFFLTAVQIALPLVAVLFIADLGLALLTKVAPQLNALNVMFPAKIGLTLLVIGLTLPALPGVMDRMVGLANQAMAALLGAG